MDAGLFRVRVLATVKEICSKQVASCPSQTLWKWGIEGKQTLGGPLWIQMWSFIVIFLKAKPDQLNPLDENSMVPPYTQINPHLLQSSQSSFTLSHLHPQSLFTQWTRQCTLNPTLPHAGLTSYCLVVFFLALWPISADSCPVSFNDSRGQKWHKRWKMTLCKPKASFTARPPNGPG